jgi:hypothetical protein
MLEDTLTADRVDLRERRLRAEPFDETLQPCGALLGGRSRLPCSRVTLVLHEDCREFADGVQGCGCGCCGDRCRRALNAERARSEAGVLVAVSDGRGDRGGARLE